MTYELNFNKQAQSPVTVLDGNLVEDVSLTFFGKGSIAYGEKIQENLLHILENFSAPYPPTDPTSGMIWHDSDSDELMICSSDDNTWKKITGINVGNIDEYDSPVNGELFFNTNNNTLSVSIAGEWINSVTVQSTLDDLSTKVRLDGSDPVNGIKTLNSPEQPMHAANKEYVDNVISGLDSKQSARALTVSNIVLSGLQTVDGIVLAVDDTVVVRKQSAPTQNGLYLVKSAAWEKIDIGQGAYLFVEEGQIGESTGWIYSSNQFNQFSGPGTLQQGDGISIDGTVVDLVINPDHFKIEGASLSLNRSVATDSSITPAAFGNKATIDGYGRVLNIETTNITGEQGPIGDQGPQGYKGPVGIAGINGVDGPQGLKGIDGSRGSVGPIGDKGLTGNPGTNGAKGAKGETGDQGPIGDKGADSTAATRALAAESAFPIGQYIFGAPSGATTPSRSIMMGETWTHVNGSTQWINPTGIGKTQNSTSFSSMPSNSTWRCMGFCPKVRASDNQLDPTNGASWFGSTLWQRVA